MVECQLTTVAVERCISASAEYCMATAGDLIRFS